jgi:ubiquinone/menaquinone biosynthesis C-methylase UbiE
MSKLTDQTYLQTDQYRDASNLDARVELHERFSANKYGWHQWVFDQFDLPPKSDVLELGCGPGYLWLKNIDRIPDGWDITLSDFSPGMLQEARQNLGASRRPFKFGVIDAQFIPCTSKSFDAVIANHMLYHVPDREKAYSEIHRVLRPGGRLYAATAGRNHLRQLEELCTRFDPHACQDDERTDARSLSVENFCLENGHHQLAPWFSRVRPSRYKDALIITQAEPLVAYIASTITRSVLVGDRLAEFARFVERELALHDAIYVTKDSGMFEAFRDD